MLNLGNLLQNKKSLLRDAPDEEVKKRVYSQTQNSWQAGNGCGWNMAIGFLEERCSYTDGMHFLCKEVKTYLRNIPKENGKGISINLGT